MPQLNDTLASQIDDREATVGVLEPGVYVLALVEVEAKMGNVAPMWVWKFEIPEGVGRGRQLYHNTSLSENAQFKLKETFDAFGVPANTNTDALLGHRVRALVTKSIAAQGKRQGQFVNQIQELYPIGTGKSADTRPIAPDDPTGHSRVTTDDDEPPF